MERRRNEGERRGKGGMIWKAEVKGRKEERVRGEGR